MATVQNRRGTQRFGTSMGRMGPRRVKVAIQRVSPWSVLKFSLLFYLCLMLVVLVGLVFLFLFADAVGIIDDLERLLGDLGFGGEPALLGGEAEFEVNAGYLFRMSFLIGLISTVVWSALTVCVALLYNLISDLVGSIEMTLQERR